MVDEVESRYSSLRRFKRRKLIGRVAVVIEGRLRFEAAAEISEGGMLLRVREPLPIGTIVELRFFLPQDVFVSAHGEVGYKLEPQDGVHLAGVRFLSVGDEMKSRIAAFVSNE